MAGGQERRYRHRVNTRRIVNCRSMLATGSRSPFEAETIDVSSGGIGLLVNVKVRAGTPLTVELRFDNPKLNLSLDGVVMHAAPMEGRFFAGVRFVGIGLLHELELSRFVMNENQLLRANVTDRQLADAAGGIASDDRSGRWGRHFPSRLAAAS